nr:leucine-rich repeat protein [Lachnospiraceae bacterium]
DEELAWINSCLHIDVPSGITSIDAPGFFEASENTRNVATYFGVGSEGEKSRQMCTDSTTDPDAVPGLFSGYYQDYSSSSPYEEEIRGNDRVLSISLNTVKSLPDYCFDSCERLEQVTLGQDLAEMGTAPFRGCDSIDVVNGNGLFTEENKILYTTLPDGSYSVKECLPSRTGTIDSDIDSKIKDVSEIEDGAFQDCDNINWVDLSDASNLKVIPKDAFKGCDALQHVELPVSVNKINEGAFEKTPITVVIPGKEVEIATDAFEHDGKNTIYTTPDSAARRYAEYYGLSYKEIDETYTVYFVQYPFDIDSGDGVLKKFENVVANTNLSTEADQIAATVSGFERWSTNRYSNVDGNLIVQAILATDDLKVVFKDREDPNWEKVIYVSPGSSIYPPVPPTHSGKVFSEWLPNPIDFDFDNVTTDATIIAIYLPANATPAPDNGGGNGGGGGGGGTEPAATATPTPTPKGSGSSSSSSSDSGSNSGDNTKKYTVTVSGGSGTGTYAAGAIVPINAYDMGSGQTFDKWTTSTAGVGFANASSPSTYFVMPANNVAVTATYKAGGSGSAATSGSGGSGGSGSRSSTTANPSGQTTVDITKSGISNRNVAGATVTGSTDNFIVKITDDQHAADMALQALQNAFGDITRVKYLPMDISLYDSTGRTKITDTQGLAVGITMPLPDELAQYAGNNKIASVEGGTLDNLNSRFTTVDGVPCISFTATHFSPYVIYVDTANLTETTIDYTPKTGDPIHPKWFLSIGLAAVAVVLFFKRDKRIKPTTA